MSESLLPTPYPHWMLREIHEQPASLQATLDRYAEATGLRDDACAPVRKWLDELGPDGEIVIAASGSSRHAGLAGEIMLEQRSDLSIDVEYASEYVYQRERMQKRSAVVVISQSGETADTLAALRKANQAGRRTLAITNVEGSTMAREATVSFPLGAGRERSIPATKSFTGQLLNLHLLSLIAGELGGLIDRAEMVVRLDSIRRMTERIAAQMDGWEQSVHAVAEHYAEASSFLFLGRGIHYPIAREGALKLKESSYLHAEGYPSGELKHGPNALVSEDTPLVMIATVDRQDEGSVLRYGKSVQLLRDMRAQGARVLAIANAGDAEVAELATHIIAVEEMPEELLAISEVIPLQMLAYFIAVRKGIDVDHPRHLTKAVLTE
ncbi:SIS domain-containing protein [Granulicella sp. WH15]|uniref:SIS domain-containing protein n=1 Tax=Granulicella sp. WH15 TaxID=2602070 RepID=UPI001366FD1A|nr:SIS domain-containing protein [Granulicella sp. WH15]QHN03449.1 SIS domain-containing protein [Granulicella sp. WH15]